MTRRLIVMVILAVTVPGLAFAVGRPREPRLVPGDASDVPSYVSRVEPAIVALRVRAPELTVSRLASGLPVG